MANPNWIKGGQSPNEHGRPKKKSSPTITRQIERFVQRNLSPRKLQTLYDSLNARDKLTLITDLLPYAISKKPTAASISFGSLPDDQLNELFDQVVNGAGLLSNTVPLSERSTIEEIEIVNNG
jgi:hypothetical protein